MLAAVIVEGAVELQQRPDPQPGNGELLIRIKAAGINGADILQRRGRYPAPPGAPADIPGLEFAGEVIERGPGATRFDVGRRVMGIVGGGGQAELIAVHERLLMPVPDLLDWPEAGSLPEIYCTAYDALFGQVELRAGERVLINGAAGGVGTAAIQLATLTGAVPVATVRNPAMAAKVTHLGATVVVAEAGSDAAGEHGPFDVVLELVGAGNLTNALRALAPGGRVCFIGVGGGAKTEFNALHLMGKRARIHGSTLRSSSLEDKAALARAVERHVLPAFDAGALRVVVDKTFDLADVHDAYEYFAAGGKFGKVTLLM
jgi:putative PIG3 family NAD(P)H quinone oxidoreductase